MFPRNEKSHYNNNKYIVSSTNERLKIQTSYCADIFTKNLWVIGLLFWAFKEDKIYTF